MNQMKKETEKSNEKGISMDKTLKSFISGGTAGACAKTLIAPIERVKYLFITSPRKFSYKAYFIDLVDIIRNNGVKDLWRGNILNISRIFPHSAIDFAVFDYFRRRFYRKQEKYSKIVLFFCGSIAGMTALSVTTPLDFLRVRRAMQKDNFSYHSNQDAMKIIYQRQGWIGFYRGYGASISGIFVYHGMSFFIFAKLKEAIKIYYPAGYSKWYVDFMLGGISSLGQLFAYPFDILRKRMQGQHLLLQKKIIGSKQNYGQLIRSIIQNQGLLKGFYKGISLNMIKAPLAAGTTWTIKNHLNRILDPQYDL